MNKYKLTRTEQESIFSFDNESHQAKLYSACPRRIKELKELCKNYPNDYTLVSEDEYSVEVITSKANVKLKKPRIISDKQRLTITNNLKKYREQVSTLKN